jgi:hypothetical protein
MDYLVVASNNNSMNMSADDLDTSVASTDSNRIATTGASEHIYSNSHFKFEVLETTV